MRIPPARVAAATLPVTVVLISSTDRFPDMFIAPAVAGDALPEMVELMIFMIDRSPGACRSTAVL